MASITQICSGASMTAVRKSSLGQSVKNASTLVVHSGALKSTSGQLSFAAKKQSHIVAAATSSDKAIDTTPRILISEFFSAINANNLLLLSDIVSPDCKFKGLIFQISSGEQYVTEYFCKVMKARGQNINFRVDNVDVQDSKAKVYWHLEWTNKEIPFTRSSNVFEFDTVAGKLLIRGITGDERPGNSGDLILKLLKRTSSILDKFPKEAEGVLTEFEA